MIRFKTFSYGPGLFGAKNTHEEIEIFLNEIGQENIIFFTCSGHPTVIFNYTVVYNDGT